MSDAGWLLVSRPLDGPVQDGGAALLRELIPELPAEPLSYFGDPQHPLRRPSLGDEVIHVPRLPTLAGRGASDLVERGAMAAALLAAERRRMPLHLFLEPGAVTERIAAGLVAAPSRPATTSMSLATRASAGARGLLSLASSVVRARPRTTASRPAPVVQTLTCATGLETWGRLLEPLDAVVALSDDTRSRLLAAGLPSGSVHRIYPGVRPGAAIPNPAEFAQRRAILYAGELDVGATDRLIELARILSEPALRGWLLIIASRPDDLVDRHQRIRLGRELAGAIGSGRVELHGEVPDLRALARRCAIQLWVADKIHRRLDLPLALLEGLASGLALVAVDRGPIREVFTVAEQRGRNIGALVDPALGPGALAAAIITLIERPELILRVSEDAAALTRETFSSARMAADVAALHRELLARFRA